MTQARLTCLLLRRKEKEKLREQEDKERRERRAREANEAWARIRKALGARPEPAPTSPDDWNTLLASLLPDNTDSAAAAAAAVARNRPALWPDWTLGPPPPRLPPKKEEEGEERRKQPGPSFAPGRRPMPSVRPSRRRARPCSPRT